MRRNNTITNAINLISLSNYKTVSADYTLVKGNSIILADSLTANITVTLPSAVNNKGKMYVIKKVDDSQYTVNIQSAGSDKIDGNSSFLVNTQWNYLRIFSNGSLWLNIS